MKIAEDLRRSVLQAAIEGSLTGGMREGWRFVELNEIFQFVDYRGMTPIKSAKGIFLITASNIRKGYMDYTRKEYISPDEYCRRLGRGITEKGDLLFTTEAPMGHVSICDLEQCSCGQRIITLKARAEVMNKLYMYFMLSDYFQKQLLDNCTGTTAKGIKADKLKHFLVPFPPINEQRRIVSRLDAILPLIAELESAENELKVLERKFPNDMRDALLQAAIEGNLTGGKREGWQFVRLGDVISLISGADLPSDQHNAVGNGTPYITGASNIVNGSLIINRWTTTPKKIAKRGDILLTCKGTIGANCILELEEAHIARQVMAIRVIGADTKFVHYYIQHYVDTLKQQAKSMIPGIERKNIIEAPISLPPINEQRRIVSRLNELLPLCEALETIIQGHKEMRISWNISSKRFA